MTEHIKRYNNDIWQPTTDKVELAVMGKLGEELAECGSVVNRCVIHGVHSEIPGEADLLTNEGWLCQEIADVLSCIRHAIDFYGLDKDFIFDRANAKYEFHKEWHAQLSTQA